MTQNQNNPQLEALIFKLRNPLTEKSQFRTTLETVGEQIGYIIAQDLPTAKQEVKTQLGKNAYHNILAEQPIIIGVLRAGIPFMNGLLRAFPDSEAGFIGAMRDEKTAKSTISYVALPNIYKKIVILADTMLATGGSIIESIKILEKENPKEIIIASAIASKPGIENILKYKPDIKIHTAVSDPILNDKYFIVPGLGDAGDRSYGRKE